MTRSPCALIEMFFGLVGSLLGLPWWLLGLLWRFKPYVLWLIYEAWCVHGWWSSRNVDSELARRVLQKGKAQHRGTCLVLAVWQFIVPWMLGVKYDAWGAWSPCVCAVSAWALCAMILCHYPCIFALHLQWLRREVCWYKKLLWCFGCRPDARKKRSVHSFIRQNNLYKVVRVSIYHLFLYYSTIVDELTVLREAELTEQTIPTATPWESPALSRLRIHIRKSVELETMLYTFKFVCAALSLRAALVGVCCVVWFLLDSHLASQQLQAKQLRVAAWARGLQETQRLLHSRQPQK